jgi:hypothetical protein
MRKVGFHEGFDSEGNFVSILRLWESVLNNLIDDVLFVLVIVSQDFSPKLKVLSLDKISSLKSEQIVLVSDSNNLIITFTPCRFISSESKIRISFFAVFTNNLSIIELVIE